MASLTALLPPFASHSGGNLLHLHGKPRLGAIKEFRKCTPPSIYSEDWSDLIGGTYTSASCTEATRGSQARPVQKKSITSTLNHIGCIGMHFLCWWAFCHNCLIFSYQGFLFWRHFGIFSWTQSCQTYLQQGHSPFDRRWTAPESRFWVGGARECRGLSDKLSPGEAVAASDVPITWHSSQPGN